MSRWISLTLLVGTAHQQTVLTSFSPWKGTLVSVMWFDKLWVPIKPPKQCAIGAFYVLWLLVVVDRSRDLISASRKRLQRQEMEEIKISTGHHCQLARQSGTRYKEYSLTFSRPRVLYSMIIEHINADKPKDPRQLAKIIASRRYPCFPSLTF